MCQKAIGNPIVMRDWAAVNRRVPHHDYAKDTAAANRSRIVARLRC